MIKIREKAKTPWIVIIVTILFLLAYGYASNQAYLDEVAQHRYCIEMVEQGFWPEEQCKY